MRLQFKYIGWCKEGNSDKVWGIVFLENPFHSRLSFSVLIHQCRGIEFTYRKVAIFWGRRGTQLHFKVIVDDYASNLIAIINSKKKRYAEVSVDKLNKVYPEFEQDLEKFAFWSTLKA